jgi:hypothetical protein
MVGTYKTTVPVTGESVSANATYIQQNTNYVKNNLKLDHYWAEDATLDGRHKAIQMPKTETGGTPDDPTLGTGINGALYLKAKTSAEAPDFQAVLPYFKDNSAAPGPAVLEMLGIRACAVIDISADGLTLTPKYIHNVVVTRASAGSYTATFTNAMPSVNYLVLGDCIGRVKTFGGQLSDLSNFRLLGDANAPNKTTALFKFGSYTTFTGTIQISDPKSIWFVVFGG